MTRTRKKYYPKSINNVCSANTFNNLLLGNVYNIFGEKVKPYKGIWVIVKSNFEIYLLIENDISKISNWKLIGKCINK